jgi:hypothetical protein
MSLLIFFNNLKKHSEFIQHLILIIALPMINLNTLPSNFTQPFEAFHFIYIICDSLYFCNTSYLHVKWVPCHHSKVRPRVADRGDSLQIRELHYVAKYLQAPRKWTDSLARPKHRKMDMSFGTWNVRRLYRAGSLKTVARELEKYKPDLVGVQEVGWEKGGSERAHRIIHFSMEMGMKIIS